MSYGFLGAVSGGAKAGVAFGEAVMKDEFEKRREERLEKARMEMEMQRRKWAQEDEELQYKRNFTRQFGPEADPNMGEVHLRNQIAGQQKYGEGFDPNRGHQAHATDSALDQHRRQLEQTNEVNRFSGVQQSPDLGSYQTDATGRVHQLRSPDSGSAEGRAASEAQLLAQYKESVRHQLREVIPGEEWSNMAIIDAHGGWEGWAPKYREVLEQVPDYYTWRHQVHGIELPPGMRAGNAATGARPQENPGIMGGQTETPPSGTGEDVAAQLGVPTQERDRASQMLDGLLGRGAEPAQPATPAHQSAQGSSMSNPARVQGPEDLEALPVGAYFIGPDGMIRRKRG